MLQKLAKIWLGRYIIRTECLRKRPYRKGYLSVVKQNYSNPSTLVIVTERQLGDVQSTWLFWQGQYVHVGLYARLHPLFHFLGWYPKPVEQLAPKAYPPTRVHWSTRHGIHGMTPARPHFQEDGTSEILAENVANALGGIKALNNSQEDTVYLPFPW